jgi:hypothetical protein
MKKTLHKSLQSGARTFSVYSAGSCSCAPWCAMHCRNTEGGNGTVTGQSVGISADRN